MKGDAVSAADRIGKALLFFGAPIGGMRNLPIPALQKLGRQVRNRNRPFLARFAVLPARL
ncbi:MAG: hypothetical protein P8Z80_06065 [Pseudolabrys sp.]